MQYEVEVNGRVRHVIITRVGDGFAVAVDGRTRQVDAARIDAQTLSLVHTEVWPNGDTHTADPQGPPYVRGPGQAKHVAAANALRPSYVRGPGLMRPGASYEVTIVPDSVFGQWTVWVGSTSFAVTVNGRRRRRDLGGHAATGPQRIVAPMPGKVVRVLAHPGQAVKARQPLVVVEAMKMENELRAGRDGTVAEIRAQEGALVEAGALLIVIT